MSRLSGDLGKWAQIRIPRVGSSSEELSDIRLDLILVDSQFAEWLAGGRRAEGKDVDWLHTQTSLLLERLDTYRPAGSDVGPVVALRRYVERMQRVLAGDDAGLQ